jgi:hypothetical protein
LFGRDVKTVQASVMGEKHPFFGLATSSKGKRGTMNPPYHWYIRRQKTTSSQPCRGLPREVPSPVSVQLDLNGYQSTKPLISKVIN